MTNAIKKQLADDGLKLDRLLGIGVDGAKAMAGAHNSVSSRLTEINPNLVTIKCLSHSLHKCAENTCDRLPRCLDTMVKESQSWFSKSTKRGIDYNFVHKIIADGNNPKKIAKLSGTRWLARLDAIETIIDQWDSLKLHFHLSRSERGDAGYKAEQLFAMYDNPENKLYLLFLRHALKNVVTVNKLFQSHTAEPFKLLQDLNNLLYGSLKSIVVPCQLEKAMSNYENLASFPFKNYLMATDCINFGYLFNKESANCAPEALKVIKERCKDFLIKLGEELQNRTTNNIKILEKMSLFSPEIASRQNKDSIIDIAEMFKDVCGDIDATCEEWELLHRLQIDASTSDEYWAKVSDEKNAGGEQRFKYISELALSLLSLPFSNASVERAFSIFNIIKDKLRNKMCFKTADAILRVRYLLPGNSCTNFEPTKKMLKEFKSEIVYASEFDEEVLDTFAEMGPI